MSCSTRSLLKPTPLLTANEKLADVAAQVGFADQSHFTTMFRMATSMTPRSYRMAMSVESMAVKVYAAG
ncbi:MAG TPA: AraC family transcriptional regulator [Burkholderiales bacterium]|nr:AraC family transcriptional regulator [Burkholderiales bacterium]